MFTSLVLYPSITPGSSSVHTLKSNVVAMSCLQYMFKRQSHWIVVCFAQVEELIDLLKTKCPSLVDAKKNRSHQWSLSHATPKTQRFFPRWEAKHLIGEVFWIRCAFSPTSKKHTVTERFTCVMAGAEAWELRNMKIIENQLSSKDRHYTGKKMLENSASTILQLVINLVWYHCIEIILAKKTLQHILGSLRLMNQTGPYIYIYQPWILWVQISIIDFPGDFSGFDTPRSSTHPYRRNMSSLPGMKVKQVAATVSNMQSCKLQV